MIHILMNFEINISLSHTIPKYTLKYYIENNIFLLLN